MVIRVRVETETRAPTGATHAHVINDLLIDPAGESTRLDEAIERADVGHVAVTHTHADHVGGVAAYAKRYGLTTWARRGRTDAFVAATGIRPDRTYGPDQVLPGGVRVIETPGHAPDHVAFEAGNGWIVGDLAVADGSVVVGAPEGDMRAYLSSLRRLHAMDPERLYPAHGPTIDDPRTTCMRLIRHRLEREQRVLAAVTGGATTLDEILESAYDKDLGGVEDLARATVRAHLEKLVIEGRIQHQRAADF